MRTPSLMLALLAACAGPPAWAAQALGCLIEPERVVDVGSPVIGVIQAMAVEDRKSVV